MFLVAIKSINQAFDETKSLEAGEWAGDYRKAAQQAFQGIVEAKMNKAVDVHLEQMRGQDIFDRRHSSYFGWFSY
ncbi:MAG: hypothetical protein ACUVWV_16620 [Thermodesulfobacteriota bacterium]